MSRIGARIQEFQIEHFGFDKWFTVGPVLQVLWFGDAPISSSVLGNPYIQAAVVELGPALDVAVLGWHDQACLVWPFVSDASSGLQEAASYLDEFRPYEEGDAALLVTNVDWLDFLLVDISFADERIEVSRLRREPIPNPSYRLPPGWRQKAELLRQLEHLAFYNDKGIAYARHAPKEVEAERARAMAKIGLLIGVIGPTAFPQDFLAAIESGEIATDLTGTWIDPLKAHFRVQR